MENLVNERATELFGYSEEELVGRRLEVLVGTTFFFTLPGAWASSRLTTGFVSWALPP
jgi:PAS domain-containing protein